MAKDKTSFVLYSDSKSIIDLMSNEQAGLLLKTLFSYVNDENPKIDTSIALVFEMIKLQLKRDLKKWEQTKEGRSIAGKASAEARKLAKEIQQTSTNPTNVNLVQQTSTNPTNVNLVQQTSTNPTVSVSVNDSVSVNEINKVVIGEKTPKLPTTNKDELFNLRKDKFRNDVSIFLKEYSKEILRAFFDYWTEPNPSKTKMRYELQKTFDINLRLKNWTKNENTFINKPKNKLL